MRITYVQTSAASDHLKVLRIVVVESMLKVRSFGDFIGRYPIHPIINWGFGQRKFPITENFPKAVDLPH